MDHWLGKHSERLYAVMRMMAGLLFACHGAQKLFGALGGKSQLANPKLLDSGIIELVGCSLVALGLWAACAAFVSSGEMAVADFWAHAQRTSTSSGPPSSRLSTSTKRRRAARQRARAQPA
jgi:putative oxidoreductase